MAGEKRALIFGASGVSGWAMVNEILGDYPRQGIWGGVVALTNRPLSLEQSYWPKDSRLSIVSGIDILAGSQQDLENTLKEKVPEISSITHMIYLAIIAYKAQKDMQAELKDAVEMFQRATTAIDALSPALEFVVLQTGAKHYGCHLLHNRPAIMKPPLSEKLPKLPSPHAENLFYNPQIDWLTDFSADKRWGWADTRPDIIIGFVPNQNFYSLGTVIGIYLSLRREIDGEGAECPFPGTDASWKALSIDSSSDMIARQTLHIATTSPWKDRKGEAFNVADERSPSSWSEKWPVFCEYFGLKGVKAPEDNPVEVRKYIRDNIERWNKMEKKYGLQTDQADNPRIFPGFEHFLLTQFDTDRQYDMTKMYDEAGFKEERAPIVAWGGVWDRMRKAKVIPSEFH